MVKLKFYSDDFSNPNFLKLKILHQNINKTQGL